MGSGTGFKCLLVLQGTIGLLQFNSEGEIQQQLHLSAMRPPTASRLQKINSTP